MSKPGIQHGHRVQQQPDGAVRQSQMVTTYGPGSMVDLLNDAVLVGGLEFWNYDREYAHPHIDEPRLRDAIVNQFKQLGRELSQDHPFRAPPVGNDREPSKFAGIAVLEMPAREECSRSQFLRTGPQLPILFALQSDVGRLLAGSDIPAQHPTVRSHGYH